MLKHYKYSILLSTAIALYGLPADAIEKREITILAAENGIDLQLARGYGVVLNLSTVGQNISTAWLSDPSQITLASNKGPCTGQACAGASVLYLKPIDRIHFPGLPSAPDGSSLLSIITNQGKVLQFRLRVSNSTPTYTSVSVIPPLPPVVSQPVQPQAFQPSPPPHPQTFQPQPVPPPPPISTPKITINLPSTEVDDINNLAQLSEPEEEDHEETPLPETPIDLDDEETSNPEPQIVEDEPEGQKATPVDQPKTLETFTAKEKTSEVAKTDEGHHVVAVLEPVSAPSTERTNQQLALALLRGLHSHRGRAEVGRYSSHYRRAQDVIYLLKRDNSLSLEQAIARVQMDEDVAQTLIRYGSR